MPYFWIRCGLHGTFYDTINYIIKCDTRRELKSAIQWEADSLRDAGCVGLSKRNVATLARLCWQGRKKSQLPIVLPYRWQYQDYYPCGIHISNSTRQEYMEHIKESV